MPVDELLPAAILHVADLSEIGGIPHVVAALAAGQRRLGIAAHVAIRCQSTAQATRLGARFRAIDATTHDIVTPARAYRRQLTTLASLCRQLRPVVMHTHGLRSDILGVLAARRATVPVVSTIHGFTEQGLSGLLYEAVHRTVLRRADAVVAVSRPLQGQLAGAGVPAKRLHLIPNAYRSESTLLPRDEARRALAVPRDTVLAGWVGRLSREKAADVAIEAIALIRHTSLMLSLLGEGPERPLLEARVRGLGLQHRVIFHGAVPDAERLFAAFDLFVLSSRSEGTPIALFEAMHAGVPVVATAVGGVPDVVSSSEATLVPAENPGRLAGAIQEVLELPHAAAARADAARVRLRSEYSIDPWLARYGAVYGQVLKMPSD